MAKTYDLIIPLGYACSSSQTLRRAGLQLASFPWDWVGIHTPAEKCEIMRDGFPDFMNLEDLQWVGMNDTYGHEEVRNTRNDLLILHDFVSGIPLAEQHPAIAAKYERRIKRLAKCIASAKSILLVTIDAPVTPVPTSAKQCREALDVMNAAYPDKTVEYLLLNLENGRKFSDRVDESPFPGVRRIAFDYARHDPGTPAYGVEIDMLAGFLGGEYAVRDYRTGAEKAAYKARKGDKRRQKFAKKIAAIGAENAAQYWYFRVRRVFRKAAYVVGPKALAARLRSRRFQHIVPLGINCEVAFRFFCRWKFVDSSLLAWAQSRDLATVTAALRNLDSLPTGDFELIEHSHMWLHKASGIQFHGRLRWKTGAPPPIGKALDDDLADLRGRLAHLVDKLRRVLSDDESTLVVHRLADADAESSDLPARLDALESALADLGAKNVTLLVVCRNADLSRMPAGDRRVYRSVKSFNPPAKVAWEELGDPLAWNAIFTEFAPAKILPKAHSFKFE